MKAKLFLSLLSMGFLFSSCNRDASENSSNEMLLGTWKAKSVYAKSSQGENTVTLGDCEQKTNYVLTSDNKGVFTSYTTNEKGICEGDVPENFTYSYNESKKELTFKNADGSSITYKVPLLEKNTMIIELSLDLGGETFLTKTTYVK